MLNRQAHKPFTSFASVSRRGADCSVVRLERVSSIEAQAKGIRKRDDFIHFRSGQPILPLAQLSCAS